MENFKDQAQETLHKIAKLLHGVSGSAFGNGDGPPVGESYGVASGSADFGCNLRSLPERLLAKAADIAAKINPVNAPAFGLLAMAPGTEDFPLEPQRLAVMTTKYWGPTPRKLTVSFMERASASLRRKILSYMNAWTKTGCVEFVETAGAGQVRISFGPGGYYSYLGTDILLIPANRQTMNLQGFTERTSDQEFARVVCHETGHTLGFPHEHMRKELVARIDPQKAYAYFGGSPNFWPPRVVDQQVLTPLDDRSIMRTPPDQDSIMCYQLPASITRDGQPIRGGKEINATDYAFCGQIYPRPGRVTSDQTNVSAPVTSDDWSEAEDVEEVNV